MVFVITDEGKIMVDKKRAEVFGRESPDHFRWVLPKATRKGPYISVGHLMYAADKVLDDTFGLTVAANRYNFAGSYEERAPDNCDTVTYMFEVRLSDAGPTNTDPTGPSNQLLQSGHMIKETSNDCYPYQSPIRIVTVASI